jgi:hypothetical protein
MARARRSLGKRKLAELLKEYLAPAGLAALVSAGATVALLLPQWLDKNRELDEKRARLEFVETDFSAYSRVMRKAYALLSPEQLAELFGEKGDLLVRVSNARLNDAALLSAELRRSKEGVYFVWCRTREESSFKGRPIGFWLTRHEALSWVREYASADAFGRIFGEAAFRSIGSNHGSNPCG